MSMSESSRPPSLVLRLAEVRSVFEFGTFNLLRKQMQRLPKGDGHPVLVLPGFMASDRSTVPMRKLLTDLGYQAHGWGMGRNVKFNPARDKQMSDMLTDIYRDTGQKVSLVGWSLGGVFARELAKKHPEMVRMVISMGSPITTERRISTVRRLYDYFNGRDIDPEFLARYNALAEAPPVPTTSIFTKTDGVVAWQGSIQKPGGKTENIRVPASHIGLGVNPLVMVALADRLAQPLGKWKPFSRAGWRAAFFRKAA